MRIRHVFTVERLAVAPVPVEDRHGHATGQFTLWLAANLTIADFALGFLPVGLGVPWAWTIAGIIVGNLLGGLALAAAAAMGPASGVPQMVLARRAFGRIGGRLPALLNYVSTLGWYTVNTILATFGIRLLIPEVAFWQAALGLVVVQGMLGAYGHDLVHRFERLMAIVLGVLFVVLSAHVIAHPDRLSVYHGGSRDIWPSFAIVVAATLSYLGSWSPYGADYSRYLPPHTSRRATMAWSFLGSVLAAVWLELLGVAVAVLAGPHAPNPTAAAHTVLGSLGTTAVIAIILGAVAANAVNGYSNSLSAAAVGLPAPRWLLALVAAAVGLFASVASSGHFASDYQNFLLLLGYWFTPWLGVQAVDFFAIGVTDRRPARQPISLPAVLAFLLGIGCEIPFMSSQLYTGPIAQRVGGADLSFYVGFVVAAVAYYLAVRPRGRLRTGSSAGNGSGSEASAALTGGCSRPTCD